MGEPGSAYAPDDRFAVTVTTGAPYASWCTACKAYTLVVTPLYLLTRAGIRTKMLALCSVCDDD